MEIDEKDQETNRLRERIKKLKLSEEAQERFDQDSSQTTIPIPGFDAQGRQVPMILVGVSQLDLLVHMIPTRHCSNPLVENTPDLTSDSGAG